jgi:hypothetical protein
MSIIIPILVAVTAQKNAPLLLIVPISAPASAITPSSDSIVKTQAGEVQGVEADNIFLSKGFRTAHLLWVTCGGAKPNLRRDG